MRFTDTELHRCFDWDGADQNGVERNFSRAVHTAMCDAKTFLVADQNQSQNFLSTSCVGLHLIFVIIIIIIIIVIWMDTWSSNTFPEILN